MNLSDQLTITARKQPDKTAYIFEGKHTAYLELEGAINKFAEQLYALGYKKGDHIALVTGNSPHFVIGMYGALRAGVVVVPVNPLYTPRELTYILNNGDVKGIITMDVLLEKFAAIDRELPNVKHYIVCETGAEASFDNCQVSAEMKSFAKMIRDGNHVFTGPSLRSEDLAIILYTSGTTGKPKGAMLSHGNLYSNAKDVADYLTINSEDRVIAALPMFHVFCLTVALNAPLMNGGTVIIMPKFSPQAVFQITKAHQPTVFAGVPTMYNYLLQTAKNTTVDLAGIRLCISGGSAMPVALLKEFEQYFDVIISEGYGLSEASPVTCFNPLDRPRKPGSIGRSIIHVENKVVDTLGKEIPAGEVGELIVKGPNVMKGYYKLPEETAAVFNDGWLYTGDMARMDDEGYFYIVDRKKDLVLVGGYNVYPREVEEALYEHPNVTEVAVVGVPHPDTGEAVVSFAVVNDVSLTEEDLLAYCRTHLAKYKVPVKIEFMDELPKNTTGKILRRNLRNNMKENV